MSDHLIKAIKSGLAVGMSLFLGQLFNIESLFFAAIAAVIATQPTGKATVKIGVGRVYSTLIGALAGGFFFAYVPMNPALMGLTIALLVFTCQGFLKMSQSNIASIVFLGILVNLDPQVAPADYVLHRTIDTSLGVIVAILVSFIPLPRKAEGARDEI